MAKERTLCIIKPDAVEKRKHGAIVQRLLDEGFAILNLKQIRLTRAQAEGFYAVHKGKGFFDELCTFMTRGPVVVAALERENAVQHYRDVIGATDPAKAEAGTVRKLYGTQCRRERGTRFRFGRKRPDRVRLLLRRERAALAPGCPRRFGPPSRSAAGGFAQR